MAKNKKNIDDFKKALTSNTFNFSDELEEKLSAPHPILHKDENEVQIAPDIIKKLSILSKYQNEKIEDIVNQALQHFLRLKSHDLQKAIEQLTIEATKNE